MKALCVILLVNYAFGFENLALNDFVYANNKFTSKLYKEISKKNLDNFIVSPFSAETTLALTALGTKGETASELFDTLELPTDSQKITEQFRAINQYVKSGRFATIETANKIYIENGFGISPDFVETADFYFNAGVQNVNFGEVEETSSKINKWVENRTNKKIKDIVSSDKLNELTRIVLVNALYVKALWVHPFRIQNTKPMDFHKTKTETVQVDTMQATAYREYAISESLDATFIKLPYIGIDLHLSIVLPNKIDGLNSLENSIDLLAGPQNYTKDVINLFLPKFKVETSLNLVPTLQNLGVKKLFNRDADLSGMSIKEGLHVSNVVQKVFMNIDEKGTEAAAATAVISNARSAAIPRISQLEIKIDRPFLFFLKLKNVVLFSGRISVL